ncbi:MAG: peptidoglycan editing factor PgeF [Vicinamibacterales bacterium]
MTPPTPDPAFHWTREPWGHALRCVPLSALAQHLFTSKQLALPGTAAWSAALTSLGASDERLMRVKQVHGKVVRILGKGGVAEDASEQEPDGDAIVSNQPGLALAVMVADCVPILLVDPVAGAAAAIHAGWRGTCARVAPEAIASMKREFGSNPVDLLAAIGPSAGPDDYEVGESLVEAFRAAGHPPAGIDRWFIRSSAKPHLDLWAANRDQLVDAGLRSTHIHVCGLSTVSNPDVFDSYRVAGERAGRMAGIIVVPALSKPDPDLANR